MSERATLTELFEFANKVREAGGGNPLDALMPAVPEDATQCLIAKNLNFNCAVDTLPITGTGTGGENIPRGTWCMFLESKETRDRIADAMGLVAVDSYRTYDFADGVERVLEHAIALPAEIGAVAHDFDLAMGIANEVKLYGVYSVESSELAVLEEMAPYIDAATREAYNLASIINEDGTIVI